jgi:hypothetical protein
VNRTRSRYESDMRCVWSDRARPLVVQISGVPERKLMEFHFRCSICWCMNTKDDVFSKRKKASSEKLGYPMCTRHLRLHNQTHPCSSPPLLHPDIPIPSHPSCLTASSPINVLIVRCSNLSKPGGGLRHHK